MKKCAVFTGSGVSAESGIATFRGSEMSADSVTLSLDKVTKTRGHSPF